MLIAAYLGVIWPKNIPVSVHAGLVLIAIIFEEPNRGVLGNRKVVTNTRIQRAGSYKSVNGAVIVGKH